CRLRCEEINTGMRTLLVVDPNNLADALRCVFVVLIYPAWIKFVLQDTVDPLGQRIIVGAPVLPHADGNAKALEYLGVFIATIVYAPVRMVDQIRRRYMFPG